MRLFGWDCETWDAVLKWAGVRLAIADEGDWPALLRVRRKWMEAGGPMSGPSGKLIL